MVSSKSIKMVNSTVTRNSTVSSPMTNYHEVQDSSSPESRYLKANALSRMSTKDGAKAEAAGKPIWVNPFMYQQGRRCARDWFKSHISHCQRNCSRCLDVRRSIRLHDVKNAL